MMFTAIQGSIGWLSDDCPWAIRVLRGIYNRHKESLGGSGGLNARLKSLRAFLWVMGSPRRFWNRRVPRKAVWEMLTTQWCEGWI